MKEEVKRWIDKAKDDLRKAEDNFNIKNFDLTAFLCQQSVEKALKALLIKNKGEIIKTHDLLFLAKLVNLPANLEKYCKELSLVYVYTRYPDMPEIKDIKNKAQKYINYGKEILEWVKKNI